MSPDNARTLRRTRLLSALLTTVLIAVPLLIAGGVYGDTVRSAGADDAVGHGGPRPTGYIGR